MPKDGELPGRAGETPALPGRLWSVPRDWQGQPAFVIAGGPSVTQEDVDKLRGRHVVVVNKSYEKAPWAEYFITHDPKDWPGHKQGLAAVGFTGRLVTCSKAIVTGNVLRLQKVNPPPGIAIAPNQLAMRRTTVTAALNFVFHLGARPIVLLGADMRAADDGRTHHHSPYPYPARPDSWDAHIVELRLAAAALGKLDVPVINCSLVSRLDCWPKVPLDDVLASLAL